MTLHDLEVGTSSTCCPWKTATTAVFFASDDACFVTGQVLCVDGGACTLA